MWTNACLACPDSCALGALLRNTPSSSRLKEVTLAHLATIAPEELERKLSAPLALPASRPVERLSLTASLAPADQPRIWLDR